MTLLPGDTLGIIGGGQLGRMIAMAAARLGLKTIVLDPAENAPAAQCASELICAAFDDGYALSELARKSTVITYEFENVNVDAIKKLTSSTDCHPNPKALATSQDRLVEKQFFLDRGIATAPFKSVETQDELTAALAEFDGEGILKTRRFGYDGKGQVRLSAADNSNFAEAIEVLESAPCILEGLVSFEREISVIAARAIDGAIECYDPAENVHREGILRTSSIPANASVETIEAAQKIASSILDGLDYVGVIGVEFFVMADGGLIANEYAPRVHNSGHWTEAACCISQFEQHVRAVAGMQLGKVARHSDCIMENLIGDDVEKVSEILKMDQVLLHLYGKDECRPGRKMGHFTRIGPKSA